MDTYVFKMHIFRNRLNMNRMPYSYPHHTNTNNAFCLVPPVYAMDTYVFKMHVFRNRLNMNRMPYSYPRSAYSTCRSSTL